MLLREKVSWIDPLSLARGIPEKEEHWVFFYSGQKRPYTGRYSILGLRAKQMIQSESFAELEEALDQKTRPYENMWFGYLGYGLKNTLEELPKDKPGRFNLPALWMINFRLLLVFDHAERHVEIWAESPEDQAYLPQPVEKQDSLYRVAHLTSNMSNTDYLQKVRQVLENIAQGEIYQANLTRKFYGAFEQEGKPFELFARLCERSPSGYSAFLRLGETYVLSSSPERFLTLDAAGVVDVRPIKGTAPRFEDVTLDEASRQALLQSEKNRAENVMIVDLMRNDLSRSCRPGTVVVEDLYQVTSYATIHHMASTIKGQKSPNISGIELIKGCFPPGSMTGAPKIRAMQICTQIEQVERGVYSGAIGWFGGDGTIDLSVVIRTLLLQPGHFEFQTGGAIVADSDPDEEWRETLDKAKAIIDTLDIPMNSLEKAGIK